MKTLLICLIPLLGPFIYTQFDSDVTVKHYTIHAQGEKGQVTLKWKNIHKLCSVYGTIDGVRVSGKNHQSGELKLHCNGVTIELSKTRIGNKVQWKGIGYDANDCSNFDVVMTPRCFQTEIAAAEFDTAEDSELPVQTSATFLKRIHYQTFASIFASAPAF